MSVNDYVGSENAIASRLAPTRFVQFLSNRQAGKKYQQQHL
jgi:hypothetical protein